MLRTFIVTKSPPSVSFKSLLLSTEVEGIFNVSETVYSLSFVTKEEGRFHNDLMTFYKFREKLIARNRNDNIFLPFLFLK